MSACLDGKSAELFSRHKKLMEDKPWRKDQHYFKNCQLTRLALMKIWSHAHEGALNPLHGNPTEVIGILLGYVADETVRFAQQSTPGPARQLCCNFEMFFPGHCHRCD
jgi:hypothetical protein